MSTMVHGEGVLNSAIVVLGYLEGFEGKLDMIMRDLCDMLMD